MSKKQKESMDIFKSPIRKTNNNDTPAGNIPPYSPFVDYTPRRANNTVSVFPTQDLNAPDSNPNSISYARERRSQYYHQLVVESNDPFTEEHFMDSPVVRRHFGFIDHEPAPVPLPTTSFNDKIQQAIAIEELSRKKEWHVSDFHVDHHLGTGKFGVVFKATELRTKQSVALKVLKKKELQDADVIPFLKREVEIQAHLNHPNIVRLYGYFHDKDHIYLVLEYAGDHDLHTILAHCQRFTEEEAAHYILEIAQALKYMHQLGVFHRDIKLENIMVHSDGRLKLADFGWAVYDPRPRRSTLCGTLDYLPPEMIQNKSHNQSVDVWAIGILCYELLTGRPPFENTPNTQDLEAAYERILTAPVVYPDYVSEGAKTFIGKLLCRIPSARISVADIEKDPWIKSFNTIN